MAGALFLIAKRAWVGEQVTRWNRQEPPRDPVPGDVWFADPLSLPTQLVGVSPPAHAGSSVKIDSSKRDLSQAFCPRPFLIVSNELLLDQRRAWVCPLSTSAGSADNLPDWVVALPEVGSYCLCAKLQSIETTFFDDYADRELLSPLETISPKSMHNVRTAVLRYLDGDFTPPDDVAPPGTIIMGKAEHLVVGSCDLSALYFGARTLTTTVLLRTDTPPDGAPSPGRLEERAHVPTLQMIPQEDETEREPEPGNGGEVHRSALLFGRGHLRQRRRSLHRTTKRSYSSDNLVEPLTNEQHFSVREPQRRVWQEAGAPSEGSARATVTHYSWDPALECAPPTSAGVLSIDVEGVELADGEARMRWAFMGVMRPRVPLQAPRYGICDPYPP